MPRIGVGLGLGLSPLVAAAGGYDADAQAFFDRVTTAGGTLTTTEKNATNQLVLDMKSAGIWTSMKAIYPMVGGGGNLLSYTETFSNSFWGGNSSKTPNYGTAPDGTTTACRFYNGGYMQTSGISKNAGTYVFSFYVKMTSGTSGSLRVFLDGGNTTTTVSVTSTWTRVEVTKTFGSFDTGTTGFFTDSDVLIWHPQLELGSTATTYTIVAGSKGAEAAAACAQNLKSSSFTGTFTSGWTFASTGVTPNGTSAYMDSTVNTNGFTSLHYSYYSRTNNTSGRDMGNESPLPYDLIISLGGTLYQRFSGSSIIVGITNSNGFYVGTQDATNLHRAFRNAVQLGTTVANIATYNNANVWIGGVNPSYYGSRECAFSSIGDGLTDIQASNFYTAVQAFQTTLSRNV